MCPQEIDLNISCLTDRRLSSIIDKFHRLIYKRLRCIEGGLLLSWLLVVNGSRIYWIRGHSWCTRSSGAKCLTMPTKKFVNIQLNVQKWRVGIVLWGRLGFLSLVTFNSCWQVHLPCLEGGTRSGVYVYLGSEKGRGETHAPYAPCPPCRNLPMLTRLRQVRCLGWYHSASIPNVINLM